jgi:secreted PhoX family phosphatase
MAPRIAPGIPSVNPSLDDLADPARRQLLRWGPGLAAATFFAPLAGCATGEVGGGRPAPRLGFQSVPASPADAVTVPPGYVAEVLAPWGEPVGIPGQMPAWQPDASNTAAEQAVQMGMHHDGLEYFALDGSRRGLLVINHEYTDDGLLHVGGQTPWTPEKVLKAQAAHGISVIEVELQGGRWQPVRPSPFARRVTANTPLNITGPAAGHALLRTAADPAGLRVLGTIGNCAGSRTPWGTFLSGEENWSNYFTAADVPTAHEKRWDIRRATWYRWPELDERFDTVRHPHEPNRFGWVVELDPMDPASTPVKRTALGRAAHEGATVAVTRDRRAVVYSGEDRAFEYIYKFVSRDRIRDAAPGLSAARANAELLDHGTLYVARFDAGGSGRWLPLVHGQGPLTAANGFADQGEVLVKTRQAADALGATKMDRPEWVAVSPQDGWVYCTLTNNGARGAEGRPGADAANPRASNTMGQIVRWKEDGDFDGEAFSWNHLLLAGDPEAELATSKGNVRGDAFSSPDTVVFDQGGLLWIGTDIGNSVLLKGEMARFGNNALLACDPATGEVRRFLTGPVGCEITGGSWTPDGRTLFISIQHPGETPGARNDPARPDRFSRWPDARPGARPRSASLAIRRLDGGVIGS